MDSVAPDPMNSLLPGREEEEHTRTEAEGCGHEPRTPGATGAARGRKDSPPVPSEGGRPAQTAASRATRGHAPAVSGPGWRAWLQQLKETHHLPEASESQLWPFCPPGDSAGCLGTSLSSQLRGVTGTQWPGKLQHTLQCTEQPRTRKHPAPNVNSVPAPQDVPTL